MSQTWERGSLVAVLCLSGECGPASVSDEDSMSACVLVDF